MPELLKEEEMRAAFPQLAPKEDCPDAPGLSFPETLPQVRSPLPGPRSLPRPFRHFLPLLARAGLLTI